MKHTVVRSVPAQRGAAAAQALDEGIRLDWGDVATTTITASTADAPTTVSLDAAGDPRTGWQYAHWLVAHSGLRGVERVRYADREWSADRGDWAEITDEPTSGVVLAEVYAG